MVKRNIISGLLLLFLAMMLGPYMVFVGGDARADARGALTTAMTGLGEASAAYDGDTADAAAAGNLAASAAKAQLAQAAYDRVSGASGSFKVAHVHGNLEGVLNIVVGLFLGLIAVSEGYRLAASWLLIAGSWLHGGALVLSNFGLEFLRVGLTVGAALLVLGVLSVLIGVAWKGFREA